MNLLAFLRRSNSGNSSEKYPESMFEPASPFPPFDMNQFVGMMSRFLQGPEQAMRVYQLYGHPPIIGQYNHKKGHAVPPEAEQRIDEWFAAYL